MRISILQTDIVWENKQENLRRLREKLETLRGTTEIVVLPETFSTGFSMDTASLAEPTTGETIATLRQWSEEYRLALAGSYIACETASEGGKPSYYNRAFFLTPEAILTITTNATSSGWGTRQNISPPATGVPSSDIAAGIYCCLYAMTFVSRSGAAIRAMNTTS